MLWWAFDDVACVHVRIIKVVGMNYLDIYIGSARCYWMLIEI